MNQSHTYYKTYKYIFDLKIIWTALRRILFLAIYASIYIELLAQKRKKKITNNCLNFEEKKGITRQNHRKIITGTLLTC